MSDVITLLIDARQPQDDIEADRLRSAVMEGLQVEAVPTKIDRFVILERVGMGGNSVVYAAYDPKLDRRVALKLVRQDGWLGADREQARSRWLREAQTMARMSHPNVLAVHDVAVRFDEIYIVLDLVDGVELGRWLERHEPSWREVLKIFIEAGKGLAVAHAAGVVHRDFKPANVLVTSGAEPGTFDRVQVMDFGLATPPGRAESSGGRKGSGPSGDEPPLSDSGGDQITRTGMVMGTPAYMAPEQHRGEVVDAKADQFAFCVALYEALYGLRPFKWKDLEQFEERVKQGRMRMPKKDPHVPARVRRILARGLAFDPDARWPSMDELLDALGRDPRRTMVRVAIGLGMVGLVATSAGLVVADRRRDAAACDPERRLAQVWTDRREGISQTFEATQLSYASDTWRQVDSLVDSYTSTWADGYGNACRRVRAGDDELELAHLELACLEQRLWEVDGLIQVLGEADRDVVENAVGAVSALTPLSVCSPDRLRRQVTLAPEASPAEVASLRAELARATGLEHAGRYADAERLAARIVDDAVQLEHPPLRASALLRLGSIRALAGKYEEAQRDLSDAIWLAEEHRLERTAAQATTLQVLVVGGRLRRGDPGRAWARHAHAAIARLGDADLLQAELLSNLGVMDRLDGDYGEARHKHAEALAIRERVLGPDHPTVATSVKELGNAYYEWHDFEAALEQYERALALRERALGPEHPAVAVIHNNIGNALNDLDRQDEARRHLERALEVWEASLLPGHPNIAMGHHNLANVLTEAERYGEAREHYERAIALVDAALGPDHLQLARYLSNYGRMLMTAGEPLLAREALERSLELRVASGNADHPDVATVRLALGRWHAARGDPEVSLAHLRAALKLRRELFGPDHELTVQAARVLEDEGVVKGDAATETAAPSPPEAP
ncbi:MAG: serine/threonine-protein kinase [Myxococcota bacterium]